MDAFALYWASGAAKVAGGLETALGRPVTDQDLEPWTLGLRQYFVEHSAGLDAAIATLRASVATCEEFFTKHDVLLTPTLAQLPPRLGWLGADVQFEIGMERLMGLVGFTPVQNASGQPAMSVPLALVEVRTADRQSLRGARRRRAHAARARLPAGGGEALGRTPSAGVGGLSADAAPTGDDNG